MLNARIADLRRRHHFRSSDPQEQILGRYVTLYATTCRKRH